MKFQVENMNVSFTYENDYDDMMGMSTLIIPHKIMKSFCDYHGHDFKDEDYEVDYLEYGEDDLEQWLEDNYENDFQTQNADMQIILYNYIIEEITETVNIEYHSTNPYWLLHDVCHANSDVSGSSIYVDQYVEEQRIFDGIKLAAEIGMIQHVNGELLEDVRKGFKERWDYQFDIEQGIQLLNN